MVEIYKECPSSHCPRKKKVEERHYHSFNLSPLSSTIQQQLDEQFPKVGVQLGFCCAEFSSNPPSESSHALNDRIALDNKGEPLKQKFFECRGQPITTKAHFTKKGLG
jgi:hypothetical protein